MTTLLDFKLSRLQWSQFGLKIDCKELESPSPICSVPVQLRSIAMTTPSAAAKVPQAAQVAPRRCVWRLSTASCLLRRQRLFLLHQRSLRHVRYCKLGYTRQPRARAAFTHAPTCTHNFHLLPSPLSPMRPFKGVVYSSVPSPPHRTVLIVFQPDTRSLYE